MKPVRSCAFCQATEDVATCDYPVMDFATSTYARLKPGDKVHRISEQITRPAATVVSIEFAVSGGGINVPVKEPWLMMNWLRTSATFVLRKSNGQEIERTVLARSPVRVLRDRNCDTPCCSLHRCERGPGATYCQSHWRVESGEDSQISFEVSRQRRRGGGVTQNGQVVQPLTLKYLV